jgi:16S rRNA G966 N2-methylase RsmD
MPEEFSNNLLENIDWSTLDERVSREQRNREVYSPAVSLFRWWARRPHALIGEILDAADRGAQVSDPFSGGGTVAIEATRRGLPVYAQDLHPWATAGLSTALEPIDTEELRVAGELWMRELEEERLSLYGTSCPQHGIDGEVLTTFWVRRADCPCCQANAYLFPYSLLTLASRAKQEKYGFYGCNACGWVTRSERDVAERRCTGCGKRLSDPDVPQLANGKFRCRNPECGSEFPAFASPFEWVPVLVQRLCGTDAHIARPTEAEVAAAAGAMRELPAALRAEIPLGLETRRLHRAGLRSWADLYPPRQLRSMLTAADSLSRLELDPALRSRLLLALCGAGEMAGYASRWDRYYPKAFEATANHRFCVTGFAAEVNLLSRRGRGTLARRIEHSLAASRWAEGLNGSSPRRAAARRRERLTSADLDRPAVVRGSSTRQLLPDESVDLVLTDPPYYDDVQYAELGSLFLTWAQATGLVAKSVHVDLRSEAVPNSTRGTGTERYCDLLTAVLAETKRTLKPSGRVVLTFHNTSGRAWWALARALGKAGFYVNALAVAHAENETDHAKRGRNSFSRDLVIECRLRIVDPAEIVIATKGDEQQSRELLAAGRTVAELCAELASGAIKRTRSYEVFGRGYRRHLGDAPSSYIRLGPRREGTKR